MKIEVTELTAKDRLDIAEQINRGCEETINNPAEQLTPMVDHYLNLRSVGDYYRIPLSDTNYSEMTVKRLHACIHLLLTASLNPSYWFLFEEPLDGMLRLINPYIDKGISFCFDSEETNPESDTHDSMKFIGFDYNLLPIGTTDTTQDLIEAILLDQSSLY